jgi:pimeloyl-ACP methyl ester carboxylesterase
LKATFILIHGAWHGGWCFDPLRPLLTAAGHEVIAPDLPGMGGDEATLAAITLEGWGAFVADLCRAASGPVILCGHSRGGLVISAAAEQAPDAISALVYICAMLLPDGMSRASFKEQAEPNPEFDAIIRHLPHGQGMDVDREGAPFVFAQLSPFEAAQAAAARLVSEPMSARTAQLSLSDARYGSVPRHYIECLHDLTIPIADQQAMQKLLPCESVTALEADHSPFLSTPQALADALLQVARRTAS